MSRNRPQKTRKHRRKPTPRQKQKGNRRLNKAALQDAGSNAKAKVRRCVITGERKDPSQLVRFVVAPDGKLVPDVHAKLPGRGCWVTADREKLEKAMQAKAFSRAAKQNVQVESGLPDQVESLLAKQVLNLLGLARRGGHVEQGFAKVDGLLRANKAAALFEASDGAEDGRNRLLRVIDPTDGPLVVGCFTSGELSLALGRENVVHAALKDGGVSARILEECNRLHGFRPLMPVEWSKRPMALRDGAG